MESIRGVVACSEKGATEFSCRGRWLIDSGEHGEAGTMHGMRRLEFVFTRHRIFNCKRLRAPPRQPGRPTSQGPGNSKNFSKQIPTTSPKTPPVQGGFPGEFPTVPAKVGVQGGPRQCVPQHQNVRSRDFWLPANRFATPPSDLGESHRAGGGGGVASLKSAWEEDRIRVCLF